ALYLCLNNIAGYNFPLPLGEGEKELIEELGLKIERAWAFPLLTGVGGLLCGIIVYIFAPEAEGHGTDSVIHAFHRLRGFIRARVPIVKSIATAITIGTGGSAGREGPIAQIGAGFGSWIATLLHLSPRERRIAVICGVAGGIGSIFKAPLGGAIFALEVLYKRDFEFEAWVPAFISSIVAYSIFIMYWGPGHIFFVPPESIELGISQLPLYFLLGVIMGLLAVLYVKVFYTVRKIFKSAKISDYFKPAIGGVLTGLLGIMFPESLEMGYGWIQCAILNKMSADRMILVGLVKIFTTSFTVASGGSGGVFAPSLVIGGLVGGGIAKLLDEVFKLNLNVPAFTIISMMSFFSAAGKVPLAAMIMVAEMTGSYELLIPAMLACATSYLVSGEYTLYISQVHSRVESPAHLSELSIYILRLIKVKDIMTKDVVTVSPDMKISELSELVKKTGHSGFPVVLNGSLVGMITYTDVARLPPYEKRRKRVKDVMKKPIVAYEDETLDKVVHKMITYKVGRLPVVRSKEDRSLVGIVTRHDIIRGYEVKLEELHREGEEYV
ncbi:MAG: chloride channel protein, partial [Thermoprotei archaeon]